MLTLVKAVEYTSKLRNKQYAAGRVSAIDYKFLPREKQFYVVSQHTSSDRRRLYKTTIVFEGILSKPAVRVRESNEDEKFTIDSKDKTKKFVSPFSTEGKRIKEEQEKNKELESVEVPIVDKNKVIKKEEPKLIQEHADKEFSMPYSSKANSGVECFIKRPTVRDRIRMRCQCQDYYFMFAHWNKQEKALVGNIQPYVRVSPPSGRPPVNPNQYPGMCKHLLSLVKKLQSDGVIEKDPYVWSYVNQSNRV